MDEIAVHAILLQYGEWIESGKLVELVHSKKNVEARQAYNLIKAASESRNDAEKIKKHIFPNRTVWYGLPEFGPPSPYAKKEKPHNEAFKRGLIQQGFRYRDRVRELLSHGLHDDAMKAWEITQQFIQAIPPSSQRKLLTEYVKTANERVKLAKLDSYDVLHDSLMETWDRIFALLNRV